jgi:hypothetical protein
MTIVDQRVSKLAQYGTKDARHVASLGLHVTSFRQRIPIGARHVASLVTCIAMLAPYAGEPGQRRSSGARYASRLATPRLQRRSTHSDRRSMRCVLGYQRRHVRPAHPLALPTEVNPRSADRELARGRNEARATRPYPRPLRSEPGSHSQEDGLHIGLLDSAMDRHRL